MKIVTPFWTAFILLCAGTGSLYSFTDHASICHSVPCPVVSYKLTDLGPTSLDAAQLTKLEPLYSLAPSINNLGQILFNKADGGYIRDPNYGEYSLGIGDIKVFGHAINNRGEALVSVFRTHNDIEWMVWLQKTTLNSAPEGTKYHIANLGKETKAFFSLINDNGLVAGYKDIDNKLRPLVWTSCEGLHSLGYYNSYDIAGFPRGINNQGTVVGFFEDTTDSPPFIWNCQCGLDILRNYRSIVGCPGWIELADMVVTQENVVYGTYVLKYVSSKGDPNDLNKYFLYRWSPYEKSFNILPIKNFRIAAINNSNTLAGSYNGHAAIRREGQAPVDLNSLIADQAKNWELLEATGINDRGQIIGFGKFQGQMHLFLLEPAL